ncbi:MAG: hypothetical protein J5674_04090, partial [Candidatus Methanomethylophilaceae archaeon]|nr:hypothetical protein [Candidatus Methanomethylophilaceae archaeon]
MRLWRAVLATAFIVSLMAVAVPVQGSDGTAVVIEGDHVLAGDESFEAGSEIVLADGSTIAVGSHVLSIGQGSKVIALGSFTLSCSGGRIDVGAGSLIEIGGSVIPPFRSDVSYVFDGDVEVKSEVLEEGLVTMSFLPSGPDRGIHAGWGDRSFSAYDLSVTYKAASGGIEAVLGFSSLVLEDKRYDGGSLVSTSVFTVLSDDASESLDVILLMDEGAGHLYVRGCSVGSVESVVRYEESGVSDRAAASGFGRFETSISDGVLSVGSTVGSVVFEKSEEDMPVFRETFDDVTWEADLDLHAFSAFLYSVVAGDGGKTELSDVIKRVAVTAESALVEDGSEERVLTGLSFVLDRDAEYRVTVFWTEDGKKVVVESTGIVLESLAVGTDLVADVGMSVEHVRAESVSSDGARSAADFRGIVVRVDGLDLKGLWTMLSRTGTAGVQQILDSCDRVHASVSSSSVSEDGSSVFEASGVDMTMIDEGNGLITISMSFDSLLARLPARDGTLDVDMGRTEAGLSAYGSISDLIDALTSGSGVSGDYQATLRMVSERASIVFVDGDGRYSVAFVRNGGTGQVVLSLNAESQAYSGRTVVGGSLSALGFRTDLGFPSGARASLE